MDNRKERIQPAVRKETEHVMVYTAAGVAVMWCVFLALHLVMPEKVPFDYTVILGGLFGGAVAVLNFFLRQRKQRQSDGFRPVILSGI